MTRPPLPRWLLIAAAVAVLLAALPLAGMAVRVPWTRVPELLTSEAARDAAWLSLRTCAVSTVLCVLLGTPLAVLLSRSRGPLAAVARTLTALPMVLPPVVAAWRYSSRSAAPAWWVATCPCWGSRSGSRPRPW